MFVKVLIIIGGIAVLTLATVFYTSYTAVAPEKSISPPVSLPTEIPITSGDNPLPGSAVHDLPIPEAVMRAREALAEKLSRDSKSILIVSALEKDWPDSCLGLARRDEMCAQVITPGFEVVMQIDGREYRTRTNNNGSILREEGK